MAVVASLLTSVLTRNDVLDDLRGSAGAAGLAHVHVLPQQQVPHLNTGNTSGIVLILPSFLWLPQNAATGLHLF